MSDKDLMMSNNNYIVRIENKDGYTEEYNYSVFENAKYHYELLADGYFDVYDRIDLLCYDWISKKETLIESVVY